jgi:hypothetical protein
MPQARVDIVIVQDDPAEVELILESLGSHHANDEIYVADVGHYWLRVNEAPRHAL